MFPMFITNERKQGKLTCKMNIFFNKMGLFILYVIAFTIKMSTFEPGDSLRSMGYK